MSDLIDFLRARLADDERAAPLAAEVMALRPVTAGFGARLLREVDARRRRIEHYLQVCQYADPAKHPTQEYVLAKGAIERSLMFDALPYSDHADYREEWRP